MNQNKPLDAKIRECKVLRLQNLEKTIMEQMIFKYLTDIKIMPMIKSFKVNKKDRYATLEFHEHEKALQFYYKANFKDIILVRPLNIYFDLQLNDNQMKKYYFDGVNDENLRKFFEITKTIGICKFYTNYSENHKLKSGGVISFIKAQEIPEDVLKKIKDQLNAIGINLFSYHPEKGLRGSIILSNFFQGDTSASDEDIEAKIKEQIKNKFTEILGADAVKELKITPIVKRREVPDPDSEKGAKTEIKIKAMAEFESSDSTIEKFEKIRIAFAKEPEARAVLNFSTAENNSYISLFTTGIFKKEEYKDLTDREFENVLVDNFRYINKNVVQVTIFPLSYNNTFVGRVHLKDEPSGKAFIAEYINKRKFLVDFFKNENFVFDLNVDDKTQRKIKTMQRKVHTIFQNIKNANDNERKERNKKPLGMNPGMAPGMAPPGVFGMGMPPNRMPMGMPMMMNMPGPGQGYLPPMGGTRDQPPPMIDMRGVISKIIQDKEKTVADSMKNEQGIKKTLFGPVKFTLDEILGSRPPESGQQANIILSNNSVSSIIDFLKEPTALVNEVLKRP